MQDLSLAAVGHLKAAPNSLSSSWASHSGAALSGGESPAQPFFSRSSAEVQLVLFMLIL